MPPCQENDEPEPLQHRSDHSESEQEAMTIYARLLSLGSRNKVREASSPEILHKQDGLQKSRTRSDTRIKCRESNGPARGSARITAAAHAAEARRDWATVAEYAAAHRLRGAEADALTPTRRRRHHHRQAHRRADEGCITPGLRATLRYQIEKDKTAMITPTTVPRPRARFAPASWAIATGSAHVYVWGKLAR